MRRIISQPRVPWDYYNEIKFVVAIASIAKMKDFYVINNNIEIPIYINHACNDMK